MKSDERGEEYPAGTPPAQATGRAEMEVEATRVGAGEAMGEEEWAPGQSCSMLGDRMGLGSSCFPFLGCDFLTVGWGPDYDR